MCAIAGAINLNYSIFEDIKSSLFHRGPNEQSFIKYKNIELVHNRLSIQDISHGQQPFEFQDYIIFLMVKYIITLN